MRETALLSPGSCLFWFLTTSLVTTRVRVPIARLLVSLLAGRTREAGALPGLVPALLLALLAASPSEPPFL